MDVSGANNYFPVASPTYNSNLSASIGAGVDIVPVNSGAPYQNGDFVVLTVNANTPNEATFTGKKSGNNFIDVVWTEGNLSASHDVGSPIVDYDSATHYNLHSEGMRKQHKQNGTHSDITADSVNTGALTVNNVPIADVGWYKGTQRFEASGTYTKPANLKFVIVEVQGGGAAGGAANATAASQWSCGGGGGGGGYARKKILAVDLAAAVTVTVGAGGAANTGDGNNGGNSSFGSHCIGEGGNTGSRRTATSIGSGQPALGGAGGGGTGDFVINGGDGGYGVEAGSQGRGFSGNGGGSHLGGIRGGREMTSSASSLTGVEGRTYGGGGTGAFKSTSQSGTSNGGAGAQGIVIVHEYF